LFSIGSSGGPPVPPLNLVGDFGGGGMLLALGILAALLERHTSGAGQVVDAAMVDGAALLMTLFHGLRAAGQWSDEPGTNLLDSGAHFYEVYETADGGHVAVGALEPQFYARLLELLGIPAAEMPQYDRARWPEFKERIAAIVRSRTRREWAAVLEPDEACATAVYAPHEAPAHPHNAARATFVEKDGVVQPAPAPRFSRTPGALRLAPRDPGQDTEAALAAWGFSASAIDGLRADGVIG
jgi:alpha-methylacyl-CoA racemase